MALAINIVLGANTVNFSRNIQKATKQAEQQLKGFAGFAQKALDKINAGTLIGAGTLTTIAAAADKMQSLASKVKLATDGSEQFNAVQRQLRNIANEQRSSFEGVVDLYASSQRALSQLGKSQQNVIDFTRNMTMAMNLGGGSAQAQAAALTQLGQALGSGALRGDEFNSVAEQAPILMELIAKRMGVATAALRDLAKEGKITADVVYEAVSGSTQALEEMVGKTNFTMSQGWQVIKDNFGYLVHDIINETTGIAGAISDVLTFVGQNLKTIATIAGAAATAIGVKMAHAWVLAKLNTESLVVSIKKSTLTTLDNAKSWITSAYGVQTYTEKVAILTHFKNTATATTARFAETIGAAMVGGVARATMAIDGFGARLASVQVALTTYLHTNLSLTNIKNVTASAITRASAAMTGFAQATIANIGSAASYTRSLLTINGAKTAFINITRSTVSGVVGFGAAIKAGTIGLAGYTRAIVTSTVAKRAFVGTATLAAGAVNRIGTAFTAVGRIILAHPLMAIGAVIAAIVVRTMGLQKAMESLSEATAVLGELLGQMVDAGIKGFKWLGDVTLDFFSRFRSDGKQSTNQVLGFFGGLFKGTRGGFVGVLQIIARVFDLAAATIKTFVQYAWKNISSLGTAIANVFKGIGNFAISVFEGLVNHISKNINFLIDGMNAVSDFFGGGQIKRLDSVSFGRLSYGSIDFGVAGFFDAVKSNNNQYLEGKLLAAHDKITDAANQSKDAHDGLAGSLDATSKASENATKNTKKNENTQKSLTDAIKEQRSEWEKLRYEMAHPLNLEIDKVNWEIANGKFKGIDKALKKQLQDAARAMDIDIIHDELDKLVQQTAIDNMNRGQTGKLAELLGHLDNSRHKFSLLKDEVIEFNEQGKRVIKTTGKLGVALSQMALADWHEYAHASNQSIGELDKQIELVKAKGDFSKELLVFEHEYQATLDKYAHLAELDDTEAYTLIKNQAEQLKLRQQMLATQTAYQDILDGLQDEESKKLGTLQNQLDVIAKQHKLMQSMPQMSSAIDPLDASFGVLKQALDLPSVPMNAIEQLESEHQSRLDMIEGFLERQQELYKGNEDALTRITKQGEQARATAKQHYEETKNKLILTESESLFGSLANIARDGLGKQSKVYRAMFAMQQGFAIAQAGLAMQQAVSQGLAKGFPTGLADMALAVSHGAKIISAIKSVVMPVGQAHDGIMSVPKSGTWNLEKGERVLPKHTAQNLDNTLNRLQGRGEAKVIINNYTGEKTDVQQMPNGDMMVTIGKMIDNKVNAMVNQRFMQARRQGGELYGR
ncbi:tape measure protein [Moraxella haemolytica]|uniref:tape measure protein n=1 Tax=Moraxella haemolytica TaxID=2904119 RepID=UPI0025435953|nr:tape measure protein [Moraxella sp. ZY171148]WII94429.1 tape measure protein [Moraxella sp. ZY171148]